MRWYSPLLLSSRPPPLLHLQVDKHTADRLIEESTALCAPSSALALLPRYGVLTKREMAGSSPWVCPTTAPAPSAPGGCWRLASVTLRQADADGAPWTKDFPSVLRNSPTNLNSPIFPGQTCLEDVVLLL